MNLLCDGCGKELHGRVTTIIMADRDVHSTYTLCLNLKCKLALLRIICDATEKEISKSEARTSTLVNMNTIKEKSPLPEIKRLAPNILSHPCDVVLILDTGEVMVNGKVRKPKQKE